MSDFNFSSRGVYCVDNVGDEIFEVNRIEEGFGRITLMMMYRWMDGWMELEMAITRRFTLTGKTCSI